MSSEGRPPGSGAQGKPDPHLRRNDLRLGARRCDGAARCVSRRVHNQRPGSQQRVHGGRPELAPPSFCGHLSVEHVARCVFMFRFDRPSLGRQRPLIVRRLRRIRRRIQDPPRGRTCCSQRSATERPPRCLSLSDTTPFEPTPAKRYIPEVFPIESPTPSRLRIRRCVDSRSSLHAWVSRRSSARNSSARSVRSSSNARSFA
jgi:hypothetical protein